MSANIVCNRCTRLRCPEGDRPCFYLFPALSRWNVPSQDAVVKRLHVIRLSAKILKVLVTASTVGLPVGNLVPDLSYLDQDKLLEAVSSHLAAAEKLAYVHTTTQEGGW